MSNLRSLSALALIAMSATAQTSFDRTIVATRLSGPGPVTQLLAITAQGAVTPFGRFTSDTLPPLAVEIDPIDGHLLLAVDLGGGTSRIVRLIPGGSQISSELVLGQVAGPVTQLAVVGDEIFATVGGTGGGLFRMPRRGGAATLVMAQGNLEAMFVFGQQPSGILAWSGSSATAQSGLAYADFLTGQPYYGPFGFGAVASAVTGVTDVPTGLPRQLLSFADGTIATFAGFLGPPAPILLVPQPPVGGAVAMKSPGPSFSATGLGGAAFPFLYDIDPNAGTTTNVAGPLPGDPVDFAMPLANSAQVLPFGAPCGAPSLTIGSSGGLPQPGNSQFRIDLAAGVPLQAALCVAGLSDVFAQGGVPLPFVLPGGCVLHVEPLAVLFHVVSGGGAASQGLAIPNQAALLGTFVFVQWLQAPGASFLGSAALAVQVGL